MEYNRTSSATRGVANTALRRSSAGGVDVFNVGAVGDGVR